MIDKGEGKGAKGRRNKHRAKRIAGREFIWKIEASTSTRKGKSPALLTCNPNTHQYERAEAGGSKTVEEHPVETQRSLRWSSKGRCGWRVHDQCRFLETTSALALYTPPKHHMAKQHVRVHKRTLLIECMQSADLKGKPWKGETSEREKRGRGKGGGWGWSEYGRERREASAMQKGEGAEANSAAGSRGQESMGAIVSSKHSEEKNRVQTLKGEIAQGNWSRNDGTIQIFARVAKWKFTPRTSCCCDVSRRPRIPSGTHGDVAQCQHYPQVRVCACRKVGPLPAAGTYTMVLVLLHALNEEVMDAVFVKEVVPIGMEHCVGNSMELGVSWGYKAFFAQSFSPTWTFPSIPGPTVVLWSPESIACIPTSPSQAEDGLATEQPP
ncbi:hypothetical protein DFH09DRAFT_1067122 [Mycena vulgaris]|nr:hypothetical protein DFH09DRAFT_1067122 [Mycena vulgaris]